MGLKLALRHFSKNPGFALVVVLTLALGIGANTAIFSFVNSWIIRPSPFPNPDQLVLLFETDKKTGSEGSVSPGDWKDWREKSGIFDDLAAATWGSYNLTGVDEPVKIAGYYVSANFFRALGVKPALGREFTDEEQIPGGDNVVILAHALWRDRFGSDPNVLGRKITLDGAANTIVGVMPENFQYIPMGLAEVFTPLTFSPEKLAARDSRYLRPVGRLKAGIDATRARAAMIAFQASLEKTYPATNTNRGVLVRTLQEEIDKQSGNPAVKIVFAIVTFILMMACANVANLIMSRSTARRKEMAVRLAMGSGRWRLVRQQLGETLLLFIAGAASGMLFARFGVAYLLHAIPARSMAYLPNFGRVEIDAQVLLFTAAIALATGLAFGMAPALEGTRFDVNTMLKDAGGRGTGSVSANRFRKTLVGGEMALAVVVVICGGLLANSFVRMLHVDLGFDGERVLVAEVQPFSKNKTAASISQFYDSAIQRLAGLPGVERAAAAMFTPGSNGGNLTPMLVEGKPEPPPGQVPSVRNNVVTPGYLEALSIALLAGRTISEQDSRESTPVVVVNQTVVKRFFADENPLGKRLRFSRKDTSAWCTIVGVVKDVKYDHPAAPLENQVYLAFAQSPVASMSLVVRTKGTPMTIAPAIRGVVHDIDPTLPVSRVLTVGAAIEEREAGDRILTQITGFFGALALFLAAIGIYAVIAYSVSQRTQEIGVRIALGAKNRDVLTLIVRQGMGMVLGGMIVGIAGAVFMAKLLANFLYGVTPTDPGTFVSTFVALAGVALIACAIPASRAAKVDPVVALRNE